MTASLSRLAPALAALLIVVGVALRFAEFQKALPLWHDEAALAVNVQSRSVAELARPLEHDQGAPIGFLAAVDLASALFGDGERALRLVSLLAGIVALPCLFFAARRLVGVPGALVALAIAALGDQAIRYSSELKQYMLDFLVTCLLLLAASGPAPTRGRRGLALAAGGALALWFSHASAFVLAGVGAALGLEALARRDRREIARVAALGGVWLASFGLGYALITHHLAGSDFMNDFWSRAGAFWPFPPTSVDDVKWLRDAFFGMFRRPLGLAHLEIAGLAFAIGAAALAWRRPAHLVLLLAPLGLALAASAIEAYPFSSRLLLFAMPLLVIVIGAGVAGLLETPQRLARATGALLLLALVAPLLFGAAKGRVVRPETRGAREAVAWLAERADAPRVHVVTNEGAWPIYRYYASRHPALGDLPVHATRMFTDADDLDRAFAEARGARELWLVHAQYDDLPEMRRRAERAGALVEEHVTPGMSVHRYAVRRD